MDGDGWMMSPGMIESGLVDRWVSRGMAWMSLRRIVGWGVMVEEDRWLESGRVRVVVVSKSDRREEVRMDVGGGGGDDDVQMG